MHLFGRRIRRPIRLGSLRRTTPISTHWGSDRGRPVDRYYIESFVSSHRADIHGACLEIRDARYTERFGSAVTKSDILDVDASNPHATIIADLTDAAPVASESFDCVIVTQALQLIENPLAALRESHRVLRPGGVLLLTAPALSKIEHTAGLDGDFWRWTGAGLRLLLVQAFRPEDVEVRTYGNVLAAIAFLTGLACEDLTERELDEHDAMFPVLCAGRAVKH